MPGEQILSSTDVFCRAEECVKLAPNSVNRTPRGTGSSNPPRSANESLRTNAVVALFRGLG